jgi:hypothetical protein
MITGRVFPIGDDAWAKHHTLSLRTLFECRPPQPKKRIGRMCTQLDRNSFTYRLIFGMKGIVPRHLTWEKIDEI